MFDSIGKLSTEAKAIKEQLKKAAQKKVKPALQEAMKELQAKIPDLTRVRWAQYTPHFNDGDECLFGIHGVYFEFGNSSDFNKEEGDYEDGFVTSYEFPNSVNAKQAEMLEAFETELNDIESMLQEAFGDHSQVTLSSKGIEVEEYEHD